MELENQLQDLLWPTEDSHHTDKHAERGTATAACVRGANPTVVDVAKNDTVMLCG